MRRGSLCDHCRDYVHPKGTYFWGHRTDSGSVRRAGLMHDGRSRKRTGAYNAAYSAYK